MAAKNIAVFGMYPHRTSFEYAFCSLKAAGITETDISSLVQRSSGTDDVSIGMTLDAPDSHSKPYEQEAPTIDWVAKAQMVIVPGGGSFLVTGPLTARLQEVQSTKSEGGLTATLLGLGFPDREVNQYEKRIRNGEILLSVHCGDLDCADRARNSLKSTGAERIWTHEFAS